MVDVARHRARLSLAGFMLALSACASAPSETAGERSLDARGEAPVSEPAREQTAPPRAQADRLEVRATQTGLASWYGEPFHGRTTASGEIFDKTELTAAHPTWPLRSLARVTRIDTGRSVLVRINDRGPFVEGRIIDLSRAAAAQLGFVDDGLAQVRAENLGPADPSERAARSEITPRD